MLRPTEWRPRRIADFIGRKNQIAIKALHTAARERRPLAAVLLGPIGTGKTSLAHWLRCSHNCRRPDPETADPCWKCENCLRCDSQYNGEWLTYWTYEIDATQKLDREALSEIVANARAASPHISTWVFVDELTRLDEATAQPVFLKFVDDRKQDVFLAAAMTDEGYTFRRLKIHPALFDRLDKYYLHTPEIEEQVALLDRLLPTWDINSDLDTLHQLVLRTGQSFRQCLQKLELAQTVNMGRLDRFFLDEVLPHSSSMSTPETNPFANDSE